MNKLKQRRVEASLTVQELAKASKVSAPMIYKIERDERTPNVYIAKRIATALGVGVDDIFNNI
jgi:DNA-binding XRE family transcriptional regulator